MAVKFGTWKTAEESNEYARPVFDLDAQNDPQATLEVTVDVSVANRDHLLVQKAANAIGKTARRRLLDESEVKETGKDENGNPILKGDVTMIYTLSPRHKARRGSKRGDEVAEAPADSEAADEPTAAPVAA